MKLTAFQSDKGDCLLLESKDGKSRMLVDGGMRRAYSAHVAPALGKLRKAKKKLDAVYVSHIDQDHVSGVLQLLDDEAAWRVHDFQTKNGNAGHPEPAVPRPPEVGKIFHNAFHDQVGKNSGAIEGMLAATARILSGAEHPWLRTVAKARRDLATSIPEAMRVSNRIRKGQLDIPLNPEFGGKLMMVKDSVPPIAVGSIRLKIIGPLPKDLVVLRGKWNQWLAGNAAVVADLRKKADQDEHAMAAGEVDRALAPALWAAQRLGATELALAKKLGQRHKVTAPNLASLMFLAEEGTQRMLLTGDGHFDDVLNGLEHHGAFDAQGRCHVTVLKAQHHASEHNWHDSFCDRLSADRYVFCANGEDDNPDLEVLQLIVDRRMANDQRNFRFFFNSTGAHSVDTAGRAHMKKVEALVAKLAAKSKGRLTSTFIKGSSLRVL